MKFSPQQEAIFDWVTSGRGSAFGQARAGTGKTTTLVQAVARMVAPGASIAVAAYNKKISTEIGSKLLEAGVRNSVARAGTFHSFGLSAWRRVASKNLLVDDRAKRDRILESLKMPQEYWNFSTKLCSLAKNSGIGTLVPAGDESAWWGIVEHHDLEDELEDSELAKEGVRWAYRALKLSRDIAKEIIDFDDMIYMPVATNCRVWQNDWIVVDEAQDINPTRRALARRMLKHNGRALFVGDDRQAIYGFTGADADALSVLTEEFGCALLPLTVTYRCPKAVVALARTVVPDIEAHPSAPEGEVRTVDEEQLLQEGLTKDDAILCRKTAPLVKKAFQLIRVGVPCHVEGRAIGDGLLKLAKRWKTKTLPALLDRLREYAEKQTAKFTAKGKETKAAELQDRVDTLLALAEGCDTVQCLHDKIGVMFQDDAPTLSLCTVHRSKGREWDRVYVLGAAQYMPSPWARQPWQQLQEQNLIYVAYTRAKRILTLVNVTVEKAPARRAVAS